MIVCWIRRPRLAPSAGARQTRGGATRRARHETPEIRARNQQHESGRRLQHPDHAACVAENSLLQWLQPERVILRSRWTCGRHVALRVRDRVHQDALDAGALAPVPKQRGELGLGRAGVIPGFNRPTT